MGLKDREHEAQRLNRKETGAYYTPDPVVSSLVAWVVRDAGDRLIDPACGDGRFIAAHRNAVGIEQDAVTTRVAMDRAPWALTTLQRFTYRAGSRPAGCSCTITCATPATCLMASTALELGTRTSRRRALRNARADGPACHTTRRARSSATAKRPSVASWPRDHDRFTGRGI